MASTEHEDRFDPTRRGFLLGAGVVGGGLVGSALGYAGGWYAAPTTAPPAGGGSGEVGTDGLVRPGGQSGTVPVSSPQGTDTVPFYGPRQAGIETPAQTHAVFVAMNLREGADRDGIQRMLKLLTDDSARLTQGQATLADTEPELAAAPARLTVTFGFGPELMRIVASGRAPSWLRDLPDFGIDRLQDRWSGGDLLLQVCGDDPVSLAHARRMLLKDARAFTTVRWVQTGFRAARGSHPGGTTMRNLFGQVDGTGNPSRESGRMERVVWGGEADGTTSPLVPWVPNGTSLVLRRISMDLDSWDELDRPGKELVVGRRLDTGAPLTGEREHDEPDLEAVNPTGFSTISDIAHVRRSRTDNPDEAMLRRAYNYDDGPDLGSDDTDGATRPVSNAGLLFAAYQCDVDRQYVPIQRRLDSSDHLNLWTTPIGSAVFAIPPGCTEGGFIGDVLFTEKTTTP